jgi:hypothetical protein
MDLVEKKVRRKTKKNLKLFFDERQTKNFIHSFDQLNFGNESESTSCDTKLGR